MNIFVAGATGVLGRQIVRQLVAGGDTVVGLVRDRKGERRVTDAGGQARYADLFNAGNLVHAMKGCEAVIHAATAIPTKARTAPADWQLNDRIRRQGTEALARCAGQVGARTFVFQSIVWVASPSDGSPFDESSPPRPTNVTQSALDGEGIAQVIAAQEGFASAVLRCGMFYGPEAAHTRMMAQGLAARRLPIFGAGDNYWHPLHTDDAASAFVIAARAGRTGLWHVVDDEPVQAREMLGALAARLGALPPRRIPKWLARILAGGEAVDFMTQSMRTSNARFRADFGWTPKYPTYREGIEQIVTAWNGGLPR
ncbi:MAG: NAD-dependent epimerase/dehydratase family protein [Pirellulales bacterium]